MPHPEDFSIGSPESRAAARLEARRRIRCDEEAANVFISTGLPNYFGRPVVEAPDSIVRYTLPDDSIVEVIRRHWESATDRGITIYVDQTWADGSTYRGNYRVGSLHDIGNFGGRKCEPNSGMS